MSDLPSVPKRIQTEETQFRAPVSESTMQKFGSTNNYLLDNYPMPAGALFPFAGEEASLPSGFLVADGRAVSRTTYSLLFAAIGTLWGVGNGSTTFNVPDLRGRFVRGIATTSIGASGNDPDNASRTPAGTGFAIGVGSIQNDAFQTHGHGYGGTGSGSIGAFFNSGGTFSSYAFTTQASGGGTDTRPKNVSVLWIIKT